MFDVASRFNSYINDADVDGLTSMMTEDHRFTDSAGSVVSGKVAVAAAWNSFFKAFPGYRNVLSGTRWTAQSSQSKGTVSALTPDWTGQLFGGRSCGRERSHNGGFTRTLSKTGECLGCSHVNDDQVLTAL